MGINEIIQEALTLKPKEREELIEILEESLKAPDPDIEKAWIELSVKRANDDYKEGKLKTLSIEEAFDK